MAAITLLALLLPMASTSPTSLTQRDEFCGTDYYGYDWYCATTATCCSGSWQSTCMPSGYTCCTTGYFCSPGEQCFLNTDTLTQYCIASGDGPEATRSAESEGAQQTDGGGGGGGFGDDDDDDDDDVDDDDDGVRDGAARGAVSLATLSFVVGAGVAMGLL